jgi:hypothetical protein
VRLTDESHLRTLLIRERSSVDAASSDRNVIMNDLGEIRQRLKDQRDSAAAGLRNSTWLKILVLGVGLLNVSCRDSRQITSSDVGNIQLK